MAVDRRRIDAIVRDLRAVATDTQDIEVKESVLKLPASMAETVCAFANGPGGTIVLGLSEKNGFIVAPGFRAKPTADALATLCSDKLTPPIRPEVDVVEFENAQLVVARVSELPPREKPCYITERGVYQGAYVRVSDGDRRLSTYEVDRLLEERTQPTFDLEVVGEATPDDLDATLMAEVLERQRSLHPAVFANRPDHEALRMLHALGRDEQGTLRPTLAGLLALGTYPQQFFPRLTVTFAAASTSDEGSYADSQTMAGPISSVLAETLSVVRRNMGELSPAYPIAAVRETVANALVHRDYSPLARSTAVQVRLLKDRLEVTSPGGLYGTVTTEALGSGTYTSARNQYLLSLLENVPFSDGYLVENQSVGYHVICDELERAGLAKPEVSDQISSFTVIMRHEHAAPLPSDDIVRYLAQEGSASAAQIASALGLPRRTVTHRLRLLVEKGVVVRMGKPRSPHQRYRIA